MCYAEYKGYATGYSKSADYWSLGMTMIVLLTGRNPFNSDSLDYFLRFLQDEPPLVYKLFISNMKQQFDAETFNLVSQLITIDGSTRLGSGRAGLSKLKSEEYFSEIDWNKLVRKAIKPPFVPDVMAFSHREFKSFTDMKQKLLKKVKNDKQITKEQNAYFEKWYVSILFCDCDLSRCCSPVHTHDNDVDEVVALVWVMLCAFTYGTCLYNV